MNDRAMSSTSEFPHRRVRLVGSPRTTGFVQLHQALPLVERHHALLDALQQAHLPLTATVLGDRLGVSPRTVQRDIAQLLDAGVPIEVQRRPGGGYRLPKTPSSVHLTLTPGEAAAMLAALVSIGPYTTRSANTVLAKLLTALHDVQE